MIYSATLKGNITIDQKLSGEVKAGSVIIEVPVVADQQEGYVNGTNSDTLTIPVTRKCSNLYLINVSTGNLDNVMIIYKVIQIVLINTFRRLLLKSTSSQYLLTDGQQEPYIMDILFNDDSIVVTVQDNQPQVHRFDPRIRYKYIAW